MRAVIDKQAVNALAREHGIQAELSERARIVLRAALTHPPVQSGTYRNSLRLRRVRDAAIPYMIVYSTDRKAMWLEYGTGQPAPTPHFEILTRALKRGNFDRIVFVAHVRKGRRG